MFEGNSLNHRPGVDEYFIEIAFAVSKRAECIRSRVGAVIVDSNNRIVSTGYNGTLPGHPSCLSGACPRGQLTYSELPSNPDYSNCISIHAELNAILYSDRSRHENGTIYITRQPCETCTRYIHATGIRKIVFFENGGIEKWV